MSGQVQLFPSIVQFVAMQREVNNNTRKSVLGPVRCLFGVPDSRETRILVDDELRKDRENFFKRYELILENNCYPLNDSSPKKRCLENEENEFETSAKKITVIGDDSLNCAPRKVLQSRNSQQSQITDFWSSKKPSCEERLPQKLHLSNNQISKI